MMKLKLHLKLKSRRLWTRKRWFSPHPHFYWLTSVYVIVYKSRQWSEQFPIPDIRRSPCSQEAKGCCARSQEATGYCQLLPKKIGIACFFFQDPFWSCVVRKQKGERRLYAYKPLKPVIYSHFDILWNPMYSNVIWRKCDFRTVLNGPGKQRSSRAGSHYLNCYCFPLFACRCQIANASVKILNQNVSAFARKEEEKPTKLSDLERLKKRE